MKKHLKGMDQKTLCGIEKPPGGFVKPENATCKGCNARRQKMLENGKEAQSK